MSNRMTLYYAPGAASLLVHWLLIELDVPHALHLVDTAAKAQKSPEYLALNPNGVVPTLVIDGKPQYEAAALAMLLAERYPDARLAPAFDDPSRADYLQWMFNLANMVQPLFRQWWYPGEPAGEANAEALRAHCAPRRRLPPRSPPGARTAGSRVSSDAAARCPG